jgi:hypothetical protein
MKSIIVAALLVASGLPAASILIKVTLTTAIALKSVKVACRCRAAVRHLMLGSAFFILLGLPITSLLTPSIHIGIPSAPAQAALSLLPDTGDEASTSAIIKKRAEYAAVSKGAIGSLFPISRVLLPNRITSESSTRDPALRPRFGLFAVVFFPPGRLLAAGVEDVRLYGHFRYWGHRQTR